MPKYIGLSFSQCIRDMAKGVVASEDVLAIVCGTRYESREQLEQDIEETYSKIFWRGSEKFQTECYNLAFDFYDLGLLIQPKLLGLGPWAEIVVNPKQGE